MDARSRLIDAVRLGGFAVAGATVVEAELPRLEALNEPKDAAGEVEELNGFFRHYALAA